MSSFFSHSKVRFIFEKKTKPEIITVFPFLLLSLLVFCNLNGIFDTLFNISALGSPLILLCCFFIIIILPIRKSDFNWSFKSVIGFFIIFLFMGIISSLINYNDPQVTLTSNIDSTREIITALILLVTFYVFSFNYQKLNPHKNIIYIVFIFFLITLIAGVFESQIGLRNSLYIGNDSNRSLGFFGNPNETGLQAILTVILAYYLYLNKRITLLYCIIIVGIGLAGVLFSYSKMAIITYLIIFIFSMFYTFLKSIKGVKKDRKLSLKYLITIITLLTFTIGFVAIPYYKNLQLSQQKRLEAVYRIVTKGEINDKTTSTRSTLFNDAIERIKEKPIIGYGLGTFVKGGLFKHSLTHGVHNMYLRIAGETGVFTLLLFFYLLLLLGYYGIKYSHNHSGFLVISFLICFCLFSFGSHNSFGHKFIISLWGVLLALKKIN